MLSLSEKCVNFALLDWMPRGFSKIIGEGWLFCAKVRSLLSKLIFTHNASCWSCSHEIVEKEKTRLSPEIEQTSSLTNCQTISDSWI